MPDQAFDANIYLDYENLSISARDHGGAEIDIERLVEKCGNFGSPDEILAYADYVLLPVPLREKINLFIRHIKQIHVPSIPNGRNGESKSITDEVIQRDIYRMLYSDREVKTLILGTGDGGFLPVVTEAKRLGKLVVVVGVEGSVSRALKQAADDYISCPLRNQRAYDRKDYAHNGDRNYNRNQEQDLCELKRGFLHRLADAEEVLTEICFSCLLKLMRDPKDGAKIPESKAKTIVNQLLREKIIECRDSQVEGETLKSYRVNRQHDYSIDVLSKAAIEKHLNGDERMSGQT